MKSKPNILFILSDQHSAKFLSCNHHVNVKTPNLDRLASEGVRFQNAIAQNPICTPSRVCFMSGQYAHNHGVYQLSGPNQTDLPNMLGTFRKEGYKTAALGKIHCPENWIEDQSDSFLETRGCSVGGSPEYFSYIKEKGLEEERAISEARPGCLDGYVSPLSYRDTPEGYTVTKGIEFMEEAVKEEKPFIAHISFPRPHSPYAPTQEFWDMYPEDEVVLPDNWNWEMKNKAPNLIKMKEKFFDNIATHSLDGKDDAEALYRRKLRGYLGCVSMVDYAVGEVLDYLDKSGLSENTIVVYCSDHGDYACEHGILEKAPGISSDAITRIPYIWRVPGLTKSGYVCDELVESVDVFPTLCLLAGLDFPETADGKSLEGLLAGGNEPIHEVSVTEFAWSKALRKGDWRFIYYPKDMFPEEYPEGFCELYNIKEDPYELRNLFFEEDYKHKWVELKNDLLNWIITTSRVVGTFGADSGGSTQAVENYHVETFSDGKIGYRQLVKVAGQNYI